jgi:hypothetical protein
MRRTPGISAQIRPDSGEAQEDTELMAKGQVLGHEGGPRTKKGAEGAESESNEAEHRERIRSKGESSRRPWELAGSSTG